MNDVSSSLSSSLLSMRALLLKYYLGEMIVRKAVDFSMLILFRVSIQDLPLVPDTVVFCFCMVVVVSREESAVCARVFFFCGVVTIMSQSSLYIPGIRQLYEVVK